MSSIASSWSAWIVRPVTPHSVHGTNRFAIRSGEPSSAPSSTYSSGTAVRRVVAPAREEQLLDPLGRLA